MRHFTLAAALVTLAALVVGIGYAVSLFAFGQGSAPSRPAAVAVVAADAQPESPTKEAILMRHRGSPETRLRSPSPAPAAPAVGTATFEGIEVIGGDNNGRSLLEDLSHYRMVSDAGDAPAVYRLAMDLLDPGNEEDLDVGTGISYLKVAAGMGEGRAARALGEIYGAGTKVSRDLIEAYLWYAVAASQFDDPADHSDAEGRRDQIAAQLSAKELERARALAGTWHPASGPTLRDATGLIMLAGDA